MTLLLGLEVFADSDIVVCVCVCFKGWNQKNKDWPDCCSAESSNGHT